MVSSILRQKKIHIGKITQDLFIFNLRCFALSYLSILTANIGWLQFVSLLGYSTSVITRFPNDWNPWGLRSICEPRSCRCPTSWEAPTCTERRHHLQRCRRDCRRHLSSADDVSDSAACWKIRSSKCCFHLWSSFVGFFCKENISNWDKFISWNWHISTIKMLTSF